VGSWIRICGWEGSKLGILPVSDVDILALDWFYNICYRPAVLLEFAFLPGF